MVRFLPVNSVTVVEFGPQYESLDEETIEQFEDLLVQTAETVDPPNMVFDLSHTTFFGSHFIEVLLRAWKRLHQRGGRMVLCGLTPFCSEVIRRARLDQLWESYPSREEAMTAAAP